MSKGKEGLKDSYPCADPQLRSLKEENERLNGIAYRRIVAKQALELEIKGELLKKHPRDVRYSTIMKPKTLERYFIQYNFHRFHRSIGFMTPQPKWEETEQDQSFTGEDIVWFLAKL